MLGPNFLEPDFGLLQRRNQSRAGSLRDDDLHAPSPTFDDAGHANSAAYGNANLVHPHPTPTGSFGHTD